MTLAEWVKLTGAKVSTVPYVTDPTRFRGYVLLPTSIPVGDLCRLSDVEVTKVFAYPRAMRFLIRSRK